MGETDRPAMELKPTQHPWQATLCRAASWTRANRARRLPSIAVWHLARCHGRRAWAGSHDGEWRLRPSALETGDRDRGRHKDAARAWAILSLQAKK